MVERRKEITNLSIYDFGKIPPQSRDLEEAVLAACLLEKDAVPKALSILTPESFYVTAHNLIFNEITKLQNTGKPVDILTVTESLKSSGKLDESGGIYFITELSNKVASSANIETHSMIVAQKFIQREIIRISTEAIREAYEDITDVLELLDSLTVQLIGITSNITKHTAKHISIPAKSNLTKIEKLSADPGKLLGYSTGLEELDKMIHGIQPGVTLIAARPSIGKSSLMAQIVYSVARTGVPVQVFTLEVNAEKYELRMKSQISGINFSRIQTGDIQDQEWPILNQVTGEISELPIWIDECATLSMVQLRSKCLQAYTEHGVRMFAIDFIQLTEGGYDNEGLSQMSRAVKMVAQELSVPVIELSQLSREVEKRPDKKPMLSDLRNSGTLEENADVVILLYRPEYYGLKAFDREKNEVDPVGFAQIRIAKNKDGKVGTVDLKFKETNVLFSDYKNQKEYENYYEKDNEKAPF